MLPHIKTTPELTTTAPIVSRNDQDLLPTRLQRPAVIEVSYREEESKSGEANGAFWDHYLLRKISLHETRAVLAPGKELTQLEKFVERKTLILGSKRCVPERTPNDLDKDSGLLFIPGRAKKSKDNERLEHERELLKRAKKIGQPVLAICAGSWQLWESFGGSTKDISGHNVRTGMPRLTKEGKVGHHQEIHSLLFESESTLPHLMTSNKKLELQMPLKLKVNSVHWAAADFETTPKSLTISAYAEGKVVESFETKHGVPMLGIQWHPEAYYNNTKPKENDECHLNIIRYMAKAGNTFRNKRAVNADLLSNFSSIKSSLKSHGMFRQQSSLNSEQSLSLEMSRLELSDPHKFILPSNC